MGTEPSQDSVSLLRQITQGDREAFSHFYDLHASLVFTFAVRILRVQTDAEELVQDVFLSVWQKAGTYSSERGAPEAWLITMTRSRALDKLRARGRRESRVTLLNEPEQLEQVATAERGSIALGEQLAVQGVLTELPEAQRTALQLAYFDGLTQSEIATRLGVPLGTVKTRIRDGLLRLRGLLQPGKGPEGS